VSGDFKKLKYKVKYIVQYTMSNTITDVSTSGKSITFTSTINNVSIESTKKDIDISSHKNINLNSKVDSVNVSAQNCVNVTSTDKSVNLKSENGKISTIAYDDLLMRSINGTINVKSDRKELNVESYRSMEILSEQGDITIEAPNGVININALHNINITPGAEDQVYVAGNFRATKISQGSSTSESGLLVPTGTVVPYCGTTSPIGWFICDGSSYDKVTYRDLFLVIGTAFGESGSNFTVPDMRGRTIVGSIIGRDGFVNKLVGNTGGSETHTLDISEIPEHTHSVPTNGGSHESQNSALLGTTSVTTSGGGYTGSTGGGLPHSIMQPYITLNYIIKY
jgi:microcystin-dependent protein